MTAPGLAARRHPRAAWVRAKLREGLAREERSLLLLRVERCLPWRDIAAVMSDDRTAASEAALCKRFERLRAKAAPVVQGAGATLRVGATPTGPLLLEATRTSRAATAPPASAETVTPEPGAGVARRIT